MADKLHDLAELAEATMEELLAQATFDGVTVGICTNEECDYIREVEPDQDRGYCEICDSNTVQSALILAGMI